MRACCAWGLAALIDELDNSDFWLSEDAAERGYKAGRLFLSSYQWLAHEAVSEGKHLWRLRPKFHIIDHMLERMRVDRQNVRLQACFMEEDYAGKIARLARKCHRLTVLPRTFERYLLYLSLRWGRRRESERWMVNC
eukprot:7743887-Alexandrium_andersonii.AAC.2